MKIAIATDDLKTITSHVGRCNAFIIFNIENNIITDKEIRENNFTHHKTHVHTEHENQGTHKHGDDHGHEHHHSHSSLINAIKDCSHLICSGVGRRAVEDLAHNGIEVIITDEQSAEDAAINFAKGVLKSNPSLACNH